MENFESGSKIFDFLSSLGGFTAYSAILGVLLGCGLGIPIPEDITLISAGLLAGMGNISLMGAFVVGFFGVLLGDIILFSIGKKYGRTILEMPFFRKIFTPQRIAKAEVRIHKNAHFVCFVARFLPGLRAPIYLTAGILKVSTFTFILQDSLAALLSVPIWIGLGFWVGGNLDLALQTAKEIQIYILAGILILITGYLFFKKFRSDSTPQIKPN